MHPIIEEYLDKGYITKEAAVRLEDFEAMVKEAGFLDSLKTMLPKVWQTFKSVGGTALKHTAGPTIGAATGIGLAHLINAKEYKRQVMRQQEQLNDSFSKMHEAHPELKEADPNLIRDRFHEIANISPTLAGAPSVAGKLVKKTLQAGLDENDVSKLYQIESNAQRVGIKMPNTITAQIAQTAIEPIARDATDYAMGRLGATPPSAVGSATDMSSTVGVPTKSFQELVAEGRASHQANPDPMSNPYMRNINTFADRVKAAIKEGIPVPQEIKNLNLANANDVKAIGTILGNDVEALFTLFPELRESTEKKASALAAHHVLIKQAKLPEGLVTALLAASAVGLGTGVVHEVGDYMESKRRSKLLKDSWSQTSKRLKELTNKGSRLAAGIDYNDKEIQGKANETFNTLSAVAPDLATNPSVASSYISNVIANEREDFQGIKLVSEIQKNMDAVGGYKSPFSRTPVVKGFESGFQTAGGKEYVGTLAKELGKPSKD